MRLKLSIGMIVVMILTMQFVQAVDDNNIDFATRTNMIIGHIYSSAVLNKLEGNTELAVAHALHPIGELYTLIRDDLERADPEFNREFEKILNELPNKARTLTPPEYFNYIQSIAHPPSGRQFGIFDEAIVSRW